MKVAQEGPHRRVKGFPSKGKSFLSKGRASGLRPSLCKRSPQGEVGHVGLYLRTYWDSKSLKVCVWLGPPAKHNLKTYLPPGICTGHGLPAAPTPLSAGHVLPVVFTVVIMAHMQLSTPPSLVPLVTKDTHLFSSWTKARAPSLGIQFTSPQS